MTNEVVSTHNFRRSTPYSQPTDGEQKDLDNEADSRLDLPMTQPNITHLLEVLGKLPADQVLMLERLLANDHFRDEVMKCWKIYDQKGHDYTRGKGDLDRLDNFKEAASGAGVTPYQALWVYLYKHIAAVTTFVKNGRVESEPIEGRLHDVINYCLLLLLMIDVEGDVAKRNLP